MAKLCILFICALVPLVVSAIKDEELAQVFEDGTKIIDDIKETELELTIYRAQMLLMGYKLCNELKAEAEKLKDGSATKEELDAVLADIVAIIDQVNLVEGTEQSLIKIAQDRIFSTADKAKEGIKKATGA